ncbi:MAG TPA: transposase, partial [Acidimicrobiia bacterium]|nr:transposase [Acidimicrobiia bacterium]
MERVMAAGCDPHLDTVTVALADPRYPTLTVANTIQGWGTVIDWCGRNQIRLMGIEGASGYGRGLAQTLTKAGIEVVEVPTRLTARRRMVDGAGKTDPGDARTIARVTTQGEGHRWQDQPQLETLRVLTLRRDQLVTTQTADINQLRALLAEVDPEQAASLPRLRSRRQLQALTGIDYQGDPHRETVSRLIRQIASDCL